MKRLLFCILLTFFTISIESRANNFILSSRHISTRDGLPGNTINEITQDPDGFIWIATNNGLSRYDGHSTVNYSTLYRNGQGETERIGHITCDTTELLLWISTAIYTNACYDLREQQFIDWSNEPERQLNKFFLSSRGMFFYGLSFGVRQAVQRQVKDYTHENGKLPSNDVLTILEDKSHHIWMLTDKGICLLMPDGKTKTLLSGTKIIAGATDANNTYILNSTGEIFVFDSQKPIAKSQKPIAHLPAIPKINTSFVWRNQLMIFTANETFAVDLGNGKVSTIDISNGLSQGECQGYHFIANESGRLWIFPADGDMLSMLLIPDAQYSSNRGRKFHIAINKSGLFYIATYGNGLFVWNPKTGASTHFAANNEQPLFATDYLTYAICDQQDNVWLGTEAAGVYCLTNHVGTPRLIKPEPQHKGDWANAISTIAKNPVTGAYTISTRWGNIYQYSTEDSNIKKEGALPSRITASFYDREGHFWIGTDKNEVYIDNHRWPLPHRSTAFCQDAKGRIWIGTYGGGLLMTSQKELEMQHFKQFLTDGMNKSRIKSLSIDSRGMLWIATNDGICCTDSRRASISEGDFRCYNRANKMFNHNEIFTLFCHNDSIIWIGAAGSGLLKCFFPSDGSVPLTERITTKDGLPNNNVYSICADRQGNLWVATEGGTACVNSLNNIVSHVELGHIATENAAICSNKGDILFGTTNGLLVQVPPLPTFHSTLLTPRSPAITDLRINGISAFESERLHDHDFKHDENTISFYFSDFNYAAASNALYQYYLEGIESNWQPTTTDFHVDYRNLQPGHYVFHLRAGNNGIWTEPITFAFTISQPWYNTWWAWVIYLAVIALVAWYIYRNWKEKFDLHQQMKLDRQLMDFRARLFTNITHEFRTPLAIIKGAVDKLDSQQAAVQTAQRGTKRLLKLVNQFMEFRKTSTGNLRLHVQQDNIISFVKEIYLDFWAMAQQKDIQITFTPFTRDYQVPFDHNIVETVVYNLLSNAIKYTPERGSVAIRLRQEEQRLILSVEDTGPGISEAQQKVLFQPFMNGLTSQGGMGIGLYTAHQMAAIHKGTLTYERTDGGSRFTLTLPADDSQYAADVYLDSQEPTAKSQEPTASSQQLNDLIRELQPEALNDQTIIIIEDDLDMKEQIQHEIATYFRTKTYANGQSGYEGVKEEQPALVICDVMLPDMDGYDIVTRLKQEPDTAQIPVIMLTSLADEKHQIRAYQAGADDYMTKPCNWNLLIARAIQLIKWRKEADQTPERPNDQTTKQPNDQTTKRLITSQADKLFLTKLETLTAQHLSDSNFNIDQLATMMNMGRTKFFGKVKELTGVSPNKYIVKARMEQAADLLADGELNVSEVSYKVGIQDPSYFNKLFKSYYGVMPSKYVREAQ